MNASLAVAPFRPGPGLATSSPAEALAAAFLAGYASKLTRSAYLRDLTDFADWCALNRLDLMEVQRPHVALYARHLEQTGRSSATVARRLSTLAGYYRYGVQEGQLAASPVEHLRRPRFTQDSATLGLDRDELVRFLSVARAAGSRDHSLACLLGLNGLRVSEACAADVTDLTVERGHRALTVTRKGGKRALMALAPRTVDALEAHVGEREDGPLLRVNEAARLDRHAAARIVRRLARTADIGKRISPHSLRHTFVTTALDAGVPLRDVQDAAGHADPRTTRRYDRARHSLDRHATYKVAAYLE
jgi:integrase/recombinase XerD